MEVFRLFGKFAVDNTEANTAIDETTKKAKDGSKEQSDALAKVGSVAGKMATGIGLAGAAIGGAFVAAVESTRDYRTQMGLLESAFATAGHSSEEAKNTYSELNSIMGDTEAAVEASQHIALLADNEKEMNQWTDICTGVFATFGASLPVEGLTEAANHTAELGEVQGSLADALEWSGITVDDFNKELEKCDTVEQRQDLITKTLTETYKGAANQYKETNKDVIEAQKANERLTDVMAELGAIGEPIMTKIKNAIAGMAEKAVPVLQDMIQKVKDMKQWIQDNESTVKMWTGVILGAAVAISGMVLVLNFGALVKSVTTAIKTMRLAILALNTAMRANPIGIVVSLLAGLVTAFIYLWNNVDGFRNFWIKTWESIKKTASSAWSSITKTFSNIGKWFSDKFDQVKKAGKSCMDSVKKFFSDTWKSIQNVWNKATSFFQNIWKNIKNTFSSVKSVLSKYFSDAWSGIKKVWDKAKSYFTGIWSGIRNVFGSVGSWFSGIFSNAWKGIKNVFSGWGTFFSNLWNQVKSKFSSIGSTIGSTMSNAVKTGMNAVIGKIESTINKGIGLINSAIKLANKLGFNVGTVGTLKLPRLAEGAVINRPTVAMLGEEGQEAVIPLKNNTEWIDMVADKLKNSGYDARLDRIIDLLERILSQDSDIYLDSGALVGSLTPAIDTRLGYIRTKKQRGNI